MIDKSPLIIAKDYFLSRTSEKAVLYFIKVLPLTFVVHYGSHQHLWLLNFNLG